jgi:hypothetical protein
MYMSFHKMIHAPAGSGLKILAERCGMKIAAFVCTVAIISTTAVPALAARDTDVEEKLQYMQYNAEETVKSGPWTEMPWEEDQEFLEGKLRSGANVLLAGFRTVLRDPLPGEEENVHLAASMLAGLTIAPGEIFSQNGRIGPYTMERGFQKGPTYIGSTLTTTIGGGVCKIASTLYNVTALCNLEIVERSAHSMPVPYVPYGQDATVAYGARDFKFRNNTDSNLLIWAKGIDNILYIAFYGSEPVYQVEWRHEFLEKTKAPNVYKLVDNLPAGEQKVVLEGMDGAVVKSWLIINEPSGKRERYMGISSYRPMANIIEKGR